MVMLRSWPVMVMAIGLSFAWAWSSWRSDAEHIDPQEIEGRLQINRRLSGSISLFGALNALELKQGTVSVLVVVAAVLFTERLFHALNHATYDSAYKDIVISIEKELMIVGCTSFIFKCIVNTTSFLPQEWYIALEYAEILVPITTFSYCCLGIALIAMSMRFFNTWRRSSRFHLNEILDQYYDGQQRFYNRWSWLPLTEINALVEMRIFHAIFCEKYNLQRSVLSFDIYLEHVYEKLLGDALDIHPLSWGMVCCLALLNWGFGVVVKLSSYCVHEESSAPGSFEACFIGFSTRFFTCAGAVLFVMCLIVAIVSRYYEKMLMATKRIRSSSEYGDFLQGEELNRQTNDLTRLNISDLKNALNDAKAYAQMEHVSKQMEAASRKRTFIRRVASLFSFLSKCCRSAAANDVAVVGQAVRYDQDVHDAAGAGPVGGGGGDGGFGATNATETGKNMSSKRGGGSSGAGVGGFNNKNSQRVTFDPDANNSGSHELDKQAVLPERRNSNYGTHSSISAVGAANTPAASGTVVSRDLNKAPHVREFSSVSSSNVPDDGDGSPPRELETKQQEPDQDQELEAAAAGAGANIASSSSGSSSRHKFSGSGSSSSSIHAAVYDHDAAAAATNGAATTAGAAIAAANVTHNVHHRHMTRSASQRHLHLAKVGMQSFLGTLTSRQSDLRLAAEDSYRLNIDASTLILSAKLRRIFGVHMNKADASKLYFKEGEFMKEIFLFNQPWIYFAVVNALMMLIAFYWGLWLTHFQAAVNHIPHSAMWKILSIIPGILCGAMLLYIFRCAGILKAVSSLDCDVVEKLTIQMEIHHKFHEEVRENIVTKLRVMGDDPADQLKCLFEEIDIDGTDTLSRQEIELFLLELGIAISRRKLDSVYHVMDRNLNNEVSFEELLLFVFPVHKEAYLVEKKRLKELNLQVSVKAAAHSVSKSDKMKRRKAGRFFRYYRKMRSQLSSSLGRGGRRGGGGGVSSTKEEEEATAVDDLHIPVAARPLVVKSPSVVVVGGGGAAPVAVAAADRPSSHSGRRGSRSGEDSMRSHYESLMRSHEVAAAERPRSDHSSSPILSLNPPHSFGGSRKKSSGSGSRLLVAESHHNHNHDRYHHVPVITEGDENESDSVKMSSRKDSKNAMKDLADAADAKETNHRERLSPLIAQGNGSTVRDAAEPVMIEKVIEKLVAPSPLMPSSSIMIQQQHENKMDNDGDGSGEEPSLQQKQ